MRVLLPETIERHPYPTRELDVDRPHLVTRQGLTAGLLQVDLPHVRVDPLEARLFPSPARRTPLHTLLEIPDVPVAAGLQVIRPALRLRHALVLRELLHPAHVQVE